jgi:hypothetical protein
MSTDGAAKGAERNERRSRDRRRSPGTLYDRLDQKREELERERRATQRRQDDRRPSKSDS